LEPDEGEDGTDKDSKDKKKDLKEIESARSSQLVIARSEKENTITFGALSMSQPSFFVLTFKFALCSR
jgi:hypothetical protein